MDSLEKMFRTHSSAYVVVRSVPGAEKGILMLRRTHLRFTRCVFISILAGHRSPTRFCKTHHERCRYV